MEPYGIALIGCGTVGSGVAKLLLEHPARLAARAGRKLELRRIVVRDLAKPRDPGIPPQLFTADLKAVIDDPTIHVAVVPTDAIQPDMASALARVHPSQTGYISMITGPSRTADIERVLTIGVHGPARLVVVFVDELGRNR